MSYIRLFCLLGTLCLLSIVFSYFSLHALDNYIVGNLDFDVIGAIVKKTFVVLISGNAESFKLITAVLVTISNIVLCGFMINKCYDLFAEFSNEDSIWRF